MGCGASKDVLDVKLSADSKPITEAGASEDAGRISNQEEMPVPSANIACETTSSVQVLGWRRIEDRPPTASEDRPAGTRRISRAALRPLPRASTSTAATFAEPHDPQEKHAGAVQVDGMSSSGKQLEQNVSDETCESRESQKATLEDKFPKLEQHASERESALNLRSKGPITELKISGASPPSGGQAQEMQIEELQDELLQDELLQLKAKVLGGANGKLEAQSQVAGASEDAARISNQEERPIPAANFACENRSSVQPPCLDMEEDGKQLEQNFSDNTSGCEILETQKATLEDKISELEKHASERESALNIERSKVESALNIERSKVEELLELKSLLETAQRTAQQDCETQKVTLEDKISELEKHASEWESALNIERCKVKELSDFKSRFETAQRTAQQDFEAQKASLEEKISELEKERESALNIERSKVEELSEFKSRLLTAQRTAQQDCEARQKEVIALKSKLHDCWLPPVAHSNEQEDEENANEQEDETPKADQGPGKFVTATYGEFSAYHQGLSSLGAPHPKILDEMMVEATKSGDSKETFEAWNSGNLHKTTPEVEWYFVQSPFKREFKDKPLKEWEPRYNYRALPLKWKNCGNTQPTEGWCLTNKKLSDALICQPFKIDGQGSSVTSFEKADWEKLVKETSSGDSKLGVDMEHWNKNPYIEANGSYFKPADGGVRFPIRLEVFMHVLSVNEFGDYKQAHNLPCNDRRWLHPEEVSMVKIVLLRFVKGQLDGVSLKNALSSLKAQSSRVLIPDGLRVTRNMEANKEASTKADKIVESLDKAFMSLQCNQDGCDSNVSTRISCKKHQDGWDSKCYKCFYKDLVNSLVEDQGPVTKTQLKAIIDHFHTKLKEAQVSEPELIGLRLYSGPLYLKKNDSLRALGAHVRMEFTLERCTLEKCTQDVKEMLKKVVAHAAKVDIKEVSIDSMCGDELQSGTRLEFKVGVPAQQEEGKQIHDKLKQLTEERLNGEMKQQLTEERFNGIMKKWKTPSQKENTIPSISNVQVEALVRGFLPEHFKKNRYVNMIYACSSGMNKLSRVSRIPPKRHVYRGIGGVKLSKQFLTIKEGGGRGGVEFAFMSTSTKMQVALMYIGDKPLPVLFKCEVGDIDRGCSMAFLSQYPAEDEILIPAMSYLEITGNSYVIPPDVNGTSVSVTVYPARINCNQKSQTIEQIESRRKHDLLAMTFYINLELDRDLKRFVELLSEDHSVGEELKEKYRKALEKFAQMREQWDMLDPKEFNDDIKYKKEINDAIDFKEKMIEELFQMVYTDCVKENFVQTVTMKGRPEIGELLLRFGFPVQPKLARDSRFEDYDKETLLIAACRMEIVEICKELLKDQANVNVLRDDNASALLLLLVAMKGRAKEQRIAKEKRTFGCSVHPGGCESQFKDNGNETQLIGACRMESVQVCKALLKARADVKVLRDDNASAFAWAIILDNDEILNLVSREAEMFEESFPRSLNVIHDLSMAFLRASNIRRWLTDGWQAVGLIGVINALQSSRQVELPIQSRLAHVRAFIRSNLLSGDSITKRVFMMPHFIEQLACQESEELFDDVVWGIREATTWTTDDATRLLELVNNTPRNKHRCKWSVTASGDVNSIVYSHGPERSKLARAEGNQVCVCDAKTGFEVLRFRHESSFGALAFSPDGNKIASGNGSQIVLWDSQSGKLLLKWPHNRNANDSVRVVAFSPDGTEIASGGDDGYIRLWHGLAWETLLLELQGHTKSVRALAFSPDGTKIASGGDDTYIRVWDSKSGEKQLEWNASADGRDAQSVQFLVFSPDGTKIASEGSYSSPQLWESKFGTTTVQLALASEDFARLSAAKFKAVADATKRITTDDLVRLRSEDNALTPSQKDRTGKVVADDNSNNRYRVKWDDNSETSGWLYSRDIERIPPRKCALAFSPDGTKIVSGGLFDSCIRLWDSQSGILLLRLQEFQNNSGCAVAFSPDGTEIASGAGRMVTVWDITSSERIPPKEEMTSHGAAVSALAFSPDGKWLVSGSSKACDHNKMRVIVWSTDTGEVYDNLWAIRDPVTDLEFVDAKSFIARTGAADRLEQTWDIKGRAIGPGTSIYKPMDVSSMSVQVGNYFITAEGELLLVSEGDNPVAFSRAESIITTLACYGMSIAAGCENGKVLHLRAEWPQFTAESLLQAAKVGRTAEVERITASGDSVNFNVNCTDAGTKGTALHYAAKKGDANITNALVKAKADVTSQDKDGRTALHLAAGNGHVAPMRALVESDADVNKHDNLGLTALHMAAEQGHAQVIEHLVEAKADVNTYSQDNLHRTALHMAAERGHLKMIKSLVEAMADVNKHDNLGLTALHMAAENGHVQVIEHLVEAKADVNSQDNLHRTALHMATTWTPLHSWAAEKGHLKIIESLVEAKADVNKHDIHGLTALHMAAEKRHAQVIKHLVEAKADVNSQDNLHRTALHMAAEGQRSRVFGFSSTDKMASFSAFGAARATSFSAFGAARATPTASSGVGGLGQSQQKGTAAHKWTKTRGVDGATTGATTQGEYIAITHMQQYRDYSFEELRVQDYEAGRGRGTFGLAKTGFGAVGVGAFLNYTHTVRMLIEKGSRLEAVDMEGRTPLDLALANNQEEVAKLLRWHHDIQGKELKERVQKGWRDAGKVVVLDHVASGSLCEDYTMAFGNRDFGNLSTFQADVKLSAGKFYYELEIKHIRGAAQFGWATEGFTRSTDDNNDAIFAGVVGKQADALNGVYKITGDLYNGKPLFCKLNKPDRWLLFDMQKSWSIKTTENKDANNDIRWCFSEEKDKEHPSQVEKWQVWNGKDWEMDSPVKCSLPCAGVGVDAFSWGFDGVRVCKFADGERIAFGTAWQEGDVLGLACDMVSKTVSFSVNGSYGPPLGVAFRNITADWIAPTFSASRGTKVVANFGHLPFKHAPPDKSYVSVQAASIVSQQDLGGSTQSEQEEEEEEEEEEV